MSTWPGGPIPRAAFERAKTDTASYIRYHRALPSSVWVDAWQLSLADFAATLAGDEGGTGDVAVRSGSLDFEKYISKDAAKSFDWPIHPVGFAPVELLEMARLQADLEARQASVNGFRKVFTEIYISGNPLITVGLQELHV